MASVVSAEFVRFHESLRLVGWCSWWPDFFLVFFEANANIPIFGSKKKNGRDFPGKISQVEKPRYKIVFFVDPFHTGL